MKEYLSHILAALVLAGSFAGFILHRAEALASQGHDEAQRIEDRLTGDLRRVEQKIDKLLTRGND